MAHMRLIVLVVAVACSVTLIDSAVVRSHEEFTEKIQRLSEDNSLGVIGKLRISRAIEKAEDKLGDTICYSQPCGWAIYDKLSRSINSFVSNICSCRDKTYKCIRTDDDLSVSAFVYHCRQNTTDADIEAPEEVNISNY